MKAIRSIAARLMVGGTALLVTSGAVITGFTTPAQADPGISDYATYAGYVGQAYSAYEQLFGPHQTNLDDVISRLQAAITVSQTAVVAEIDQVQSANVTACTKSAALDFADGELTRLDPTALQVWALNTTDCVTTAQADISGGLTDLSAVNQADIDLNTIGPIAVLARIKAGLGVDGLKQILVTGNQDDVRRLAPECSADPLWGDSLPGQPVEVVLSCTAFNGAVGTNTVLVRGITPGGPLPAFDYTSEIANALQGTSQPVAKSALSTLVVGGPIAASSTAFQAASSNHLWTAGPDNFGHDTGVAMAPGTSPSIARLSNGGAETALTGSDGTLWLIGPDGSSHSTGLRLWPGTSPSIASDGGDGWMVAAQSNTSRLWTIDSTGAQIQTPSAMNTGTSPSIAHVATGGYKIAFAASSGVLVVQNSTSGVVNTSLLPDASPAIAAENGGWKVAMIRAGDNHLVTLDSAGTITDTGAVLAAHTSPAIGVLPAGGYEMAFTRASDNLLWEMAPNGTARLAANGLGVAPNTSPAILTSAGGFEITFQANQGNNSGDLWVITADNQGHDTDLAMTASTSPAMGALGR